MSPCSCFPDTDAETLVLRHRGDGEGNCLIVFAVIKEKGKGLQPQQRRQQMGWVYDGSEYRRRELNHS